MKDRSNFTDWNFSTLWNIDRTETINDGYPYLEDTRIWKSVQSAVHPFFFKKYTKNLTKAFIKIQEIQK